MQIKMVDKIKQKLDGMTIEILMKKNKAAAGLLKVILQLV